MSLTSGWPADGLIGTELRGFAPSIGRRNAVAGQKVRASVEGDPPGIVDGDLIPCTVSAGFRFFARKHAIYGHTRLRRTHSRVQRKGLSCRRWQGDRLQFEQVI